MESRDQKFSSLKKAEAGRGTGGDVRGESAAPGRSAGSRRGAELFGQPLEFGHRGR